MPYVGRLTDTIPLLPLSPPYAKVCHGTTSLKYMFLADFDLLRESCQDVCDRPWSKPAFHVMIDQYFKLEHAWEDIQCLNIKIPHVITNI